MEGSGPPLTPPFIRGEDHPHTLLVVATSSEHKLREILFELRSVPIRVCSLKEFPPLADCVETGRTFLENARQKADYYFRSLRHPVLAEDSGLVIPALDGFPGILSARVAADDASRIRLVLQRLEGNPHRAAKYVCSMVFRTAERIYEVEAECHGTISETPAGQEGFGYDPIFCPQDSFQTFGQMPLHAKSTFSHRAKSLRKMLPYLLRELAPGNRQ